MRGFFGELLCECNSVRLLEVAMTSPDCTFEVTHLHVICIDCKVVFYDAVDGVDPDELAVGP